MKFVIYGSFNCPYSYLASLRADRLQAAGAAEVDWRAVVHDPDVPEGGVPVLVELAELFDRELEEIRGLLGPDERYPARRPPVQPNTSAAVAGFYSLHGEQADTLRAAMFEGYWVYGDDIGSRRVLDRLGCPAAAPNEKMRVSQAEWSGIERATVPMMVLPDGKVSRGIGALVRLAELEDKTRASRPGDRG